jgi:hypothetical protein
MGSLAEGVPPDAAIASLWLATGEGRIHASALECSNENTFDGKLVEIPHHHWVRLRRTREPSGKAMLSGPDRIYRDVEFSRLDVKRIWPSIDRNDRARALNDVPAKPPPEPKSRGRKPGEGSYKEIDAPRLLEMRELLLKGRAASPEEAARHVASRAHGGGSVDSKAERLARRYRKDFADKSPGD